MWCEHLQTLCCVETLFLGFTITSNQVHYATWYILYNVEEQAVNNVTRCTFSYDGMCYQFQESISYIITWGSSLPHN